MKRPFVALAGNGLGPQIGKRRLLRFSCTVAQQSFTSLYICHLDPFLMAHSPKPALYPFANKKPTFKPSLAFLAVLLLAAIAFLFTQIDFAFPSHPWKTVGKLLKGGELEMNNPKRTVGYFVGDSVPCVQGMIAKRLDVGELVRSLM